MKIKQILVFSLVAISSAFLLNSCGPEEKPNPAPGIDFIAENGSVIGDVSMAGGVPFDLVFSVSDDSKVKTVEIKSVANGRVTPQLDSSINASTLKIKISRTSYAIVGNETWTITVTDDKGSSTSKSFTITTTSAAGGDPLKSFELDNTSAPFKVFNFQGAKAGAFNILDGTPQTINDPNSEKDIQDSCEKVEVNTWPGRWTSRNGTLFKKITGYTYDDLKNTGQLDAAWNAAGLAVKFMVVAKDDLYLAKLRGTNEKVLVQITNVVKTPGVGNNDDYVQFKFKKKEI